MTLARFSATSGLVLFEVAVLSFICQLLTIQLVSRTSLAGDLMPVLLPASHLILIPFLIRNSSYLGIRLLLAGLVLNLSVMAANGGLMPVDAGAVNAVGRHEVGDLALNEPIPGTKNVLLESEDIHLRFLSDAVVLPLPNPLTRAISLGDLLIAPGAAIAIYEIARRRPVVQPSSLSLSTSS
jgi:hypothetical protein